MKETNVSECWAVGMLRVARQGILGHPRASCAPRGHDAQDTSWASCGHPGDWAPCMPMMPSDAREDARGAWASSLISCGMPGILGILRQDAQAALGSTLGIPRQGNDMYIQFLEESYLSPHPVQGGVVSLRSRRPWQPF